jgi:ATP-dependent Clp protease ATP-binding subunit ClpA
MASIVDKAIGELGDLLSERGVSIELTPAAKEYFADKGYDRDNGARPLNRLVQDEIKRPLGDELLFGELERGGHVVVDVAAGSITFRFEQHARLRAPGATVH